MGVADYHRADDRIRPLLFCQEESQHGHPGHGGRAGAEQGPAGYFHDPQRSHIWGVEVRERNAGRPFQPPQDHVAGTPALVHSQLHHSLQPEDERIHALVGFRGQGHYGPGLSDRLPLARQRLPSGHGRASLREPAVPLGPSQRASNQAGHMEHFPQYRRRTGAAPLRLFAQALRLQCLEPLFHSSRRNRPCGGPGDLLRGEG